MAAAPSVSLARRVFAGLWLLLVWLAVAVPTLLVWAWRGGTDPMLATPALVAVVAAGAVGLWRLGAFTRRLGPRVGLAWSLLVTAVGIGWAAMAPPPRALQPGPGHRVAVVGAGAGGVHAAWMLDRAGAEVTVFEATPYVGGHAYAYPFQADDGTVVPIDTGFMFGSPTSYREMKALLALYGVGRTQTNLSLGARIDGEVWASGMDGLDPEVLRLHELADAQYADLRLNLVPFWAWLWWHGFDEDFRRRYLLPMMSVLFVTDDGLYEVSTRFMLNMLAGRTRWLDYRQDAAAWVVEGGSSAYYAQMAEALEGRIRTLAPVVAVERLTDGPDAGRVRVTWRGAERLEDALFDAVVLNVHADVARELLVDRTPYEDLVLGQVRYDAVDVVVHTDTSMFPPDPLRRHYLFEQDGGPAGADRWSLHSLPSRAQRGGVTVTPEPVVTLNPQRTFDDERFRRGWRHHRQDLWHLAMMLELMPRMQGAGNVWYAGDWVTFIGHGPAMASGIRAACDIAGRAPRVDLPTTPCVDVTLTDPLPSAGVAEERRTLCGEREVFLHNVELACSGRLAP